MIWLSLSAILLRRTQGCVAFPFYECIRRQVRESASRKENTRMKASAFASSFRHPNPSKTLAPNQ